MNTYPPDASKEQTVKGPDWTDADTPEAQRFLYGQSSHWKGILLPLPREGIVPDKTVKKQYTYGERPDKIEQAWTLKRIDHDLAEVEIVTNSDIQEVLPNTNSKISYQVRTNSTTKARIDRQTGLVQSAEREWQSDQSLVGLAGTQSSEKTVGDTQTTGKETWEVVELQL